MEEFSAFARLIDALRPWLGELVIVGGWAHRLYRHMELAATLAYSPVQTLDADIAFALNARLAGNIAAALAAADFHERLSGDHIPPVSHYALGHELNGFHAEFLAPLQGSGVKRSGQVDATTVKAGVTAQKLRHLDLLLLAPVDVHVTADIGIPVRSPTTVRVPNPVTFIAQKLLIQNDRTPEKRPQDVLYIHDTLDVFSRGLPELNVMWREAIRPALPRRTGDRILQRAGEMFRTVTRDTEQAARIPVDRSLTPERVRRTCAYGMSAIFGG